MQRLQGLRRVNRLALWLEKTLPQEGAAKDPQLLQRLAGHLSALAGDGQSADTLAERVQDLSSFLHFVADGGKGRQASLVSELAAASAIRLAAAPASLPPAVSQRNFIPRDSTAPAPAQHHHSLPSRQLPPPPPLAVSHHGLERARTTLEDFVQSYFMFHGLDPTDPADLFRFLPDLCFVEGHIYDLDEANEDWVALGTLAAAAAGGTRDAAVGGDSSRELIAGPRPLAPLRRFLDGRGLLSDRMRSELDDGEAYWALERSICASLGSEDPAELAETDTGAAAERDDHAAPDSASASVCVSASGRADGAASSPPPAKRARRCAFTQADAERALALKSFDYRVLNLLLSALRCAAPDPLALEFLSESEFLVELSDDLLDYEKDIRRNSFNFYRCLIALHGPDGGPLELARLISRHEARYEALSGRLDPELARRYQARCAEATRAGGGSALGTWVIPGPIADERAFRRFLSDSEAAGTGAGAGDGGG